MLNTSFNLSAMIQGQPGISPSLLSISYLQAKFCQHMILFCNMAYKKLTQTYIFFVSNLIYAFGFVL